MTSASPPDRLMQMIAERPTTSPHRQCGLPLCPEDRRGASLGSSTVWPAASGCAQRWGRPTDEGKLLRCGPVVMNQLSGAPG